MWFQRSPVLTLFCPGGPPAVRSPLAARPAATQKESVLRQPVPQTHLPHRSHFATAPVGARPPAPSSPSPPCWPRPSSRAPPPPPRRRHRRPRARPTRARSSVKLTPAQRAELIREADATKADTAKELGLGAKEKLVVRDVVKDADGTIHTRYERTYAGLPVLGGDLVVDDRQGRRDRGASPRRPRPQLKVVGTTRRRRRRPRPRSRRWPRPRRRARQEPRPTARPARSSGRRSGTPTLAYETVVGGLQHDGTPNELHVITDATTGKKLFECAGRRDRHRQHASTAARSRSAPRSRARRTT